MPNVTIISEMLCNRNHEIYARIELTRESSARSREPIRNRNKNYTRYDSLLAAIATSSPQRARIFVWIKREHTRKKMSTCHMKASASQLANHTRRQQFGIFRWAKCLRKSSPYRACGVPTGTAAFECKSKPSFDGRSWNTIWKHKSINILNVINGSSRVRIVHFLRCVFFLGLRAFGLLSFVYIIIWL